MPKRWERSGHRKWLRVGVWEDERQPIDGEHWSQNLTLLKKAGTDLIWFNGKKPYEWRQRVLFDPNLIPDPRVLIECAPLRRQRTFAGIG